MRRILWAIISILMMIGIYGVVGYYHSLDYMKVGVPVLNYHRVDRGIAHPLVISPEEFEQQIQYLHHEGYHSITMDDLYSYVKEGKELPSKPVLITFDDGYIDNYEEAFPILKKYNMKATLFMITSAIGEKGFVTLEQLHDMKAHGVDIESHTVHHKNLQILCEANMREELQESKSTLEKALHKPIQYIAYPGGYGNAMIATVARESGYRMGFTVESGHVTADSDIYTLPREPIFSTDVGFLSFLVRLHYPRENQLLWKWHALLNDHGYNGLARLIPLF